MAQRISPLTPAIHSWLEQIEMEDPCAVLLDKWMRCQCISFLDLHVTPWSKPLPSGHLLGVNFASFGRAMGSFLCAIQKGSGGVPLRMSAPTSSEHIVPELEAAVLTSLWKLAPTGTRLEIRLTDDLHAKNSSLAVAERYVNAGWELDPSNTQLLSEEPRIWVFCFQKI